MYVLKNKKYIIIGGVAIVAIAAGIFIKHHVKVNKDEASVSIIGGADGPTTIFMAGKLQGDKKENLDYVSISMEEAKEIFREKGDYVIIDVRRADEFAEGHIPGAINIPNESIETEPAELPDKSQMIYVYCRSGNRSKQASQKLVELGYTSVVEFGGILDWTGDIEK